MSRYLIAVLFLGMVVGCGSSDSDTNEDNPGGQPSGDASTMVDAGEEGSAPDAGLGSGDDGVQPPGRGSADPDEGEPQPYQTPAALTAGFMGDDPGQTDGCGGTTVTQIRGWIVDRIGRPISGAKAQLCVEGEGGTTQCLPPTDSGEDGVFNLDIAPGDQCLSKAAFRVIKPGSGRAPMYCNAPLDLDATNSRLIMEQPFVLYAGIPAADLPPIGDEEMTRTVTFANGVQLDIKPFDLVSPYEELGMRTVGTDERGLCFLEAAEAPTRLYAFSPDSTIYGNATVRFPNETELEPGAKVDISILGGLGCERNGEHIAEGTWQSIGTGTVNAAGDYIESDDGTSLTCLTWVGYQPL